jgi:hypothetical protein
MTNPDVLKGIVSGMKVPEGAKLEPRRSTYFDFAGDAETEMGGRFAKVLPTTITGSEPTVNYPKLAEGPWSEGPQGGDEPPLGFDINAQDPVGEVHEQARSEAKAAVVGTLRRRV